MQQPTEQKPLSFIDVLTRNLFLFTAMCICIGFGVTVSLLRIDSLDSYIFQIKSSRLDFIFFVGMAACYLSLLFVSINRAWVNFVVQVLTSIILFIGLLFIFSPPLKVKSYLFDHYVEFSTRSWHRISELPIGKKCIFGKVKDTDKNAFSLMHNVFLPSSCSYYFFSFVFTSYATSPMDSFIRTNEE